MKAPAIWGAAALLWSAFTFWYTDFKGPMSAAETDAAIQALEKQATEPEAVDRLRGFMESDTGRQFIMFNLLDMNENPPAVPGSPAQTDADGLMARYMGHLLPLMLRRASHPVFFGGVTHRAIDLAGIENAEHWEDAILVRYRSRRDIIAMIVHPRTPEHHLFKLAAVSKTIAVPVEPSLYLADPRLLLALLLALAAAIAHLTAQGRAQGRAQSRELSR